MTTQPIPLPNQVRTKTPERQLTLEQEGRLRIVTSILDRDRTRSTEDLLTLMDAVLDLEVVDDEEDET